MINALYCVHNEEDLIQGSIDLVLPYVDELIFIDNGSTDNTKRVVEEIESSKIKMYDYKYKEPIDMGAVRTFGLSKITSDWFIQIDADEFYPPESMEKIVEFVNNPGDAISARIPYFNLSWRSGFKQILEHYPDRIYKIDVVEKYEGKLPNDMTIVKEEFRNVKHKNKGLQGILEYDNTEDKSFWHPRQPKIDAPFYHLARTRGRNFEQKKWYNYNKFMHPEWNEQQILESTRINQWVTGLYPMEPITVPDYIPTNIKNPKVSVIIPNFQYAQYVSKAIESAQNQTVKPFEIIVVDDGSRDNSREIINKYDVKKFYINNGGVANARNVGVYNSSGDYFICLDSDDELAPNFIEECLKVKADVVYTDLEFIGDQTGINNYPDFSHEELKKSQIIPSACALVDRRVFEAVGGFDPGEIYEDWGFWLRIAKNGFSFKHIKQPLFKYRKHGISRIELLDSKMTEGYNQLRQRYGINRDVDTKREQECKQLF